MSRRRSQHTYRSVSAYTRAVLTEPALATTVLVGAGIFLVAAYAQAVTGFGAALVAMPLLLLYTDPVTAVFASTLAGVVIAGTGAWTGRRDVSRGLLIRLSGWSLLGIPVGLVLIHVVPDRGLQLIVVATVLVAVVAELVGERLRPTGVGIDACGIGSGAMLVATGINGPPLVAALRGLEPRRYRATLQGTFFVQDVSVILALTLVGNASFTGLSLAAAGLITIPLGWWLGSRTFTSLSAVQLRWTIVVGLTAAAVAVLVGGH